MQQSNLNQELLKLIYDLQNKVHKLVMTNLKLLQALRNNNLLTHEERMQLIEMQSVDNEGDANGKSQTTRTDN
mgnify:CR=1 FL=1